MQSDPKHKDYLSSKNGKVTGLPHQNLSLFNTDFNFKYNKAHSRVKTKLCTPRPAGKFRNSDDSFLSCY